ncbi:bifunctional alpha/beta hydrolase/class I SAM-dependent methyltransferase [Candidatus Vampirococcus lugosii]|uniref:Lysophospholipase, alpha-beta hydrolase superfamily n=1 Tax=Candidatus Vampirococcus lugosii TaxID=2789015 RepID=A0ABS5QKA8_9BACT|nr:Lysophospholipase, alpha-beta hydrolase superfamily [Candidatus Vampirococcus lugosii]
MLKLDLSEKYFTSHDNKDIYYKSWTNNENKKAIILIHRGHEHSGRIAHLVDELNTKDTNFFAWDARGNGKTEGKRGYSPDFSYLVKDLDYFVKHITKEYGIEEKNIILIAQSVGAVVASTWLHDYAPKIKCAVLASPAFNVNLIIPGLKHILKLWQKIRGNYTVKSYVKGKDLTHDIERSKSYDTDPLISLDISSNILLELYENSDRVIKDASAINIPVLLLTSGDDKVVFKKEQKIFFDNLSSSNKEHHILEGFYHDTLGEKDRHIAMKLIEDFIEKLESGDNENNNINLFDSYKKGYTYDEFIKLSKPLNKFSLKNINFATTKFFMRTLGKSLSKGINIAEKTGYDSGSTLDYVYKNQAEGKLFIGKILDKSYLNSIGWKGIRKRRENLEKAINIVINKLEENKKSIKIMDIAAGHGRYILNSILPYKDTINSVILRDYSDINVEGGKKLIQEKSLENIVNFKKADAFDKKSISDEKNITLGIVSGLYELFTDNNMINSSLEGLYNAIEKDGYLIYTNQPWHPQIEFIARVLTSHRQSQNWVMRRRTQAEMDSLVENVGFKKIDQFIDKWGIFTVSIAKKI